MYHRAFFSSNISYIPPTIEFMQPLIGTKNEMNFASLKYYVLIGDEKMWLNDDEVLHLILLPTIENQKNFGNLMMTDDGDVCKPAHSPKFLDMQGRVDLPNLHISLQSFIEENPGMPPFQTKFYEQLIDPFPKVDFREPPYPMSLAPFMTQMGCYADGLQVFSISSKMSSIGVVVGKDSAVKDPTKTYFRVNFTPCLDPGMALLPAGGRDMIWNTRGFAHLSLEKNLTNICNNYKPFVVILTETRVSKANFIRIYDTLEPVMDWEIDEVFSSSGGVIVLWDSSVSDVDLMKSLAGISDS